MPDGWTLVAGPVSPLSVTLLGPHGILGPDGRPLTEEHTYYALDASGELGRVYDTMVSSVEHELYATTYRVVGTELHAYHSSCDHHSRRSTHRNTIECAGLTPLPPEAAPSRERIAALLADRARREADEEAARRGRREAIRSSFVSALPDQPGDALLRLEVALEDEWPVVRLNGGPVVWRAESDDYSYKELTALLRSALPTRYGDRPVELLPSPEIVHHLGWDPWN
ncbi:hypothetical protein GCM10017673_37200 [Streptosporangium violaceochromogenes]|nr:hypothetical protein GCM10017673_37200 [Streptosporangium violaceochromogenes]